MSFVLLSLLLVAFLWSAVADGADAPQWGQRWTRNMASEEKNLPSTFNPGRWDPQEGAVDPRTTRNVRWTAPIGEVLYGTPVVAEGCVFVGSNHTHFGNPKLQGDKGVFTCLEEKDGSLRWELVVPKLVEVKFGDWYNVGICSTPVVENGKVYLVTNRAEVLCLDINGLADGNQGPYLDEAKHAVPAGEEPIVLTDKHADILWQTDMVAEVGAFPHNASSCSVLIDGDAIYVCTGNGVDWTHRRALNSAAPTLIVLDKATGAVLAVDEFGIGPNIIHGQWSSPTLAEIDAKRLILQGTGSGWLFAVDALTPEQFDDAKKRHIEGKPPLKLKTVWKFNGHPLAQTQDVVPLEHFHDTKSYEVVANPVFADRKVYVVFTQELYHNIPNGWLACLDPTKTDDTTHSGLLWAYNDISSSGSTVAVVDGLLYVVDNSGKLHCVDAETGKPYWVHNLGGAPVWASPLVADGKVFIGTGRRLFWILRHGKEPEVLSRIQMPEQIMASPVAANGVLYVPTFGTLYAVSLPSPP